MVAHGGARTLLRKVTVASRARIASNVMIGTPTNQPPTPQESYMSKTCQFPYAPAFSKHPWNGDFTVTTFKERWSWGFRVQNAAGEVVRTGSANSQSNAWSEGCFALDNIQPLAIPA